MVEFIIWVAVLFCVAVVAFECGRKRGFKRGKFAGEFLAKDKPAVNYPPRPKSPKPAPPPRQPQGRRFGAKFDD